MCLWVQGIDDNGGSIGRVRQAHGIRDDDRGVGRERGVYDASEGLDTTTDVTRIQGRRQRLQRRDDRPGELVTTTEAL